MSRERGLLLAVGTAAFAVAFALVGSCVVRGATDAALADPAAPLAVVLVPSQGRSDLVIVDLSKGRVHRRVHLRSLVTDIDVDAATGLVVAAQSGGIGEEADDALSVIDPRSGDVRYVALPFVDPVRVVCAAGRAFALHSLVQTEGLAVSVVAPASGRVVATGHVPDGPGMWAAGGGVLWTCAAVRASTRFALVRVDPSTLKWTRLPTPGVRPAAAVDASGTVAVLGDGGSAVGPGNGRVALIDPVSGAVVTSAATSLGHAPSMAAVVGDRLVVGDWEGEEPEGHRLETFTRGTLEPLGGIDTSGVPCAIAAYGESVLAVDRIAGRLLLIDPASRTTLSSVDLGVSDLIYSDLVVVPKGSGLRRPPPARTSVGVASRS